MSVQRPGPDTSQDDDPTSIVRVLDEYKITRRQSMKRRERSPIAQQIHFEDSIFGGAPPSSSSSINDSPSFSPSHSSTRRLPAHWSKIPKLTALGPDPLENISVLQPQTQHSFSNASNILQEANESQDKIEKNKLHMNLVEKERQFLEAQNNLQKMEAKLQKMELMLKKERMEREAAEEKMRMKLRRVEDEKNNFEEEVGILRKREKNRKDLVVTESVGRRESKNNLEDVNRALLEQNQDLQNQVRGYEQETEEHRHFYTEEANHLRYQIQQLQSHVAEAQAQSCRDGNAAKENSELKQKLEEADTNLQRSQQEVAKLKNDIAQNEDAEILRRAMKDKLARYPNLVKENESLKMENNLLNETMENTELLKKQINELKEDLERAQKVARDVLKAQSDVVEERRRVRRWEGVCLGILSTEEKASLGDNLGPEAFEQKMAMMQRNELVLKGELENLKST